VVGWLSVYPIITLLLWLLGPMVSELPVPVVTLILTLVLVTLQTYVVMPFMTRLFEPWLMSGKRSEPARGAGDPGRGDGTPDTR
jgi:antibiotic biosynthesis monooxygenase (ABM) superfamily enzyme